MEPPTRKNRRPVCEFFSCENLNHAHGLCRSHDAQRRNGKPLTVISFMADSACSVEGCGDMAKSKGMCQKHYAKDLYDRKRANSAHPCDSCDGGVAYWTSKLCESCKAGAKGPTAAERKAAHLASRGDCAVPWCEKPVSSRTVREGTRAASLCERHAGDSSAKTLPVADYVALMSITACEACGSAENLVVDHRHGHHGHVSKMCPDCIRGRLCSNCNSALGLLMDDVARIEDLLAYAKRL